MAVRSIRPLAALATLGAMALLSGCVVAALPVLAAGGVIGTSVRKDRADRPAPLPPRVAVETALATPEPTSAAPRTDPAMPAGIIVRSYELSDTMRVEVMTALPGRAAEAPAPAAGTQGMVVAGPAPAPGAGSASYAPLAQFAREQGALPLAGVERRSALLADPGALKPKMRECSIHPPAVLIDLDPAQAVLDPARAARGDPALGAMLADLRDRGLAIAWLSGATADRAGAIRKALVASGLDPAGRDELVLLRYREERKQTRREDLSRQLCIVAIAGDERGDFDELYLFLKDIDRALTLEPLIGQGWFLIPQPLTPN